VQTKSLQQLGKSALFGGTGLFFYTVAAAMYQIAWGTGNQIGAFSLKWGIGFVLSVAFLLLLLALLGILLHQPSKLAPLAATLLSLRQKLSPLRAFLAAGLLFLPIYILQYTLWGLVFTDIYVRLFIWLGIILLLAMLLTKEKKHLISWQALFTSTLLTAVSIALAGVFANVSAYPFNLYWSDGNRLWDYSIMFGRERYNYPADQPIEAFISAGRQFLWGLPFLIPNSSILVNRFWSAVLYFLPSAMLGWFAFRTEEKTERMLLGLWAFLFLNQGPIYTPLVLSAILVALAWERPLWLAIPLVAVAGYYAKITRWTWEFAPAIWIGILSLSGIKLKGVRLSRRQWARAMLLAASGLVLWLAVSFIPSAEAETKNVSEAISAQPLLWYRLLPNDTYPEGILGGLLAAIFPLVFLLGYWLKKGVWQLSFWQKTAIATALTAFLAVGLVISTKIGGGNNLHNLDMFLIALFFTATIAWKNGGQTWFRTAAKPTWVKMLLLLLLALPAFPALKKISPRLSLSEAEILEVQTLTDYNPQTDPPVATLPPEEEIQNALDYIGTASQKADAQGEVLFIDLRQLLTFGYVPKIRLVPEYEKKRMMEASMRNDREYFSAYYADLAAHRFSLIITEPLKLALKNEAGVFAEESDAWTKWVAAPTLCFYEPIKTFKSVYAQILVPRQEALDCSAYLP
jgi:hypothetical protein